MYLPLVLAILAVFLMIAAGYAARRTGILTEEATQSLARSVTAFFYPALIFSSITPTFTTAQLAAHWVLPAGAAGIMATGWVFGLLFSRWIPFTTPRERNTFLFQTTINNYSHLPMPIIAMLWGPPAVGQLMFSTLGSETAVWTIGVLCLGGNHFTIKDLKHLLSVPMLSLLASIAIIVLRDIPACRAIPLFQSPVAVEAGSALFSAIAMFGRATIPLAMFVAGGRMADITPQQVFSLSHAVLCALRLAVIPAATIAALLFLPLDRTTLAVLTTVAIMPCAIASIVLSETYRGDTRFAASTVLSTHLLSLFTIPAWLGFLMPAF